MPASFNSAAYWEARYRTGETSGAGSLGRLARFKAAMVNCFIAGNFVQSMIDVGCGDASQLALLTPPADYVGVDVSPTALARCAALYPGRRFITPDDLSALPPAEVTLSLDVLYHLIEDSVFDAAMWTLFAWATRFVIIYASNVDATWPAPHVRHRRFSDHAAACEPDWRLVAHLPNPCPFDPMRPDETSFADFFIYARHGMACTIRIPPV